MTTDNDKNETHLYPVEEWARDVTTELEACLNRLVTLRKRFWVGRRSLSWDESVYAESAHYLQGEVARLLREARKTGL